MSVSLPLLFPLLCPKPELTLSAGTQCWERARRFPVALAQEARKRTPNARRVGEHHPFFRFFLFSQVTAPKWQDSLKDQNSEGGEPTSGLSGAVVPRAWGPNPPFFFSLSVLQLFWPQGCGHSYGSTWQSRVISSLLAKWPKKRSPMELQSIGDHGVGGLVAVGEE